MSSLTSVPPSILDLVTGFLHPKDISILWGTGSRMLQRSMSTGGVTKFELKFSITADRRWPSRVSAFRSLRILTITAPFGSGFYNIDVKSLPPSITHLHLEFNEAESCFYLQPKNSSHMTPEPEMVDISSILPNLRSIVLAGAYHVSNQFVSTFPKTVHTISVQTIDDVQPPGTPRFFSVDGLEALPPELETLSVQGYCPWGRSDFLKLPSTLQSLNLLGTCPIEDDCFSALPPMLVNFELTGCNRMLVASDSLASLPQSLTNLKLRHVANMSSDCFKFLPRSLESLEIGGPSLEIDSEAAIILPPRLTSLHISDCSFSSERAFYHLPKRLSTLVIRLSRLNPTGAAYTNDFSKGLPRTLTHLDIVNTVLSSSGFSNEFVAELPRTILVLRLIPHHRMTAEMLAYLNPNLLEIDLGSAPMPNHSIDKLPRHLTKINIRHWGELNAEGVAHLPRLLDSLILIRSVDIDDKAVALLPPNLTHLELRNSPKLTDACVALLPRGLKTLSLDGSHLLTGAITASLPPGLTCLRVASAPLERIVAPPKAPSTGVWAYVRSWLTN